MFERAFGLMNEWKVRDLLHGWAAWIVSIGYALVLWCTVLSADGCPKSI
jgi:hypothetical protein